MTSISELLGRYGCPVCLRRFTSLAEKKTHIKLKHDRKPKGKR